MDATSPTFHPFPRLPPEIRIQIWQLAVKPRNVPLCSRLHLYPGVGGDMFRMWPPSIMHVCSESRQVAPYQKVHLDDEYYVWINFDIDMACVAMGELSSPNFSVTYAPVIQRLGFVSSTDQRVYDGFCLFGVGHYRETDLPAFREACVFAPDLDNYMDCHEYFGHRGHDRWSFVDLTSGLTLTWYQFDLVVKWHEWHRFGYWVDLRDEDIDELIREERRCEVTLSDLSKIE